MDTIRRPTARTAAERYGPPVPADPAPRANHLVAVCVWAAALGLGGLAVALRAFVGLVWQDRGWYAPTLTVIGLAGLACTIASLATIRRRTLPRVMLGLATVALIGAWIVT